MTEHVKRDPDIDLTTSISRAQQCRGEYKGLYFDVDACPQDPDIYFKVNSRGHIELIANTHINIIANKKITIESADEIEIKATKVITIESAEEVDIKSAKTVTINATKEIVLQTNTQAHIVCQDAYLHGNLHVSGVIDNQMQGSLL